MKRDTAEPAAGAAEDRLSGNRLDPVATILRGKVRGFLETMIEEEPETMLARPRHGRRCGMTSGPTPAPIIVGHRHGQRSRKPAGPFGETGITVPRARTAAADGKTSGRKSKALRSCQRRAATVDAPIASADLPGAGTRRVKRALATLFAGEIGKDAVSRVWRKVKSDRDARNARSLSAEPIIRSIPDGAAVRARLDRKAAPVSLLAALGVRQDGQKVLPAAKGMGGESEASRRALLDNLLKRGLQTPEPVIVDGAPGLEKALAALWPDSLIRRCAAHKHRSLLAHAPERPHEEISAGYKGMIYAETKEEIGIKRKAFIRKWRLKCPAAATSLAEAGGKLFTFARFSKSQWKPIRAANAIERLHGEFKRRIKTQTALPSAETAAVLFRALLASGQIVMRKAGGWESLNERPFDHAIDPAA